jgi:uncharacterized protein (TIGR04168 family)
LTIRLAFLGDLHGQWSAQDARYFDGAGYDRVVFVGDLAGYTLRGALKVARAIGAMRAPALVVPGNHDAIHPLSMLAHVAGRAGLERAPEEAGRRLDALVEALGPHPLGAWSAHVVGGGDGVTLIAGRPHSMGGPTVAFSRHLRARWGVSEMVASAARLRALVDGATTERLVCVGHNGPTGLGAGRADIWGCDFRAAEGDWGDPDLRAAVDYARARGRRVLAVVAGHMHRTLKGGGERAWKVERAGAVFVNAARVPRATAAGRHHVRLVVDGDAVTAEDRFVAPS